MSSDSDSTPVPTFSPETKRENIPIDPTSTEKVKPPQPDVHRLKLPDEHRNSTISTPDSMKVETGSDGTAEPVSPLEGPPAKPRGDMPEHEDNGSDGSWEEVKHENTQVPGEAAQDNRPVWVGHGGDKSEAQDEEGSGEDIAPEFRPRTPRPYGSHSE